MTRFPSRLNAIPVISSRWTFLKIFGAVKRFFSGISAPARPSSSRPFLKPANPLGRFLTSFSAGAAAAAAAAKAEATEARWGATLCGWGDVKS